MDLSDAEKIFLSNVFYLAFMNCCKQRSKRKMSFTSRESFEKKCMKFEENELRYSSKSDSQNIYKTSSVEAAKD